MLIFLHHFQELLRRFSLHKVADSKDFHSNTSYQDPQKMKYLTWNFGHTLKWKAKFFFVFSYHFHKNFIFTSFLYPLNNQMWFTNIFFNYTTQKYTLLCPRKWKINLNWFLDSLAGFLALDHIFSKFSLNFFYKFHSWNFILLENFAKNILSNIKFHQKFP